MREAAYQQTAGRTNKGRASAGLFPSQGLPLWGAGPHVKYNGNKPVTVGNSRV